MHTYHVYVIIYLGYGHITCKTKLGKVFTIVYSAIGIPLMMTFLANIGSSTAAIFKFIYLKINSLKRNFRLRIFKSESFYRTEIFENEFIETNEVSLQGEKICNQNYFKEETNDLKKTSSMKLSFKLNKDETKTDIEKKESKFESKLPQNDTKEKTFSQSNNHENKKINQDRDLNDQKLIVDEISSKNLTENLNKTEKLLDASKRIDYLIELNLDVKFNSEIVLNEKIDESDDEINFRTNQSLIPNIFMYFLYIFIVCKLI